MQKQLDLSIIIVNYNVKEYITQLLYSIYRAKQNYSIEIFIVDNNSTDGSFDYLTKRFPDVHYIMNEENVGFGKANNQAIDRSLGKYTLLINPDTLISENTIDVLFKHMEHHLNTGVSGCKLLNADGTFAPESKRSVPTPFSALWKILGLTFLFPKNKTFSDYYLGWMDENESAPVPVLSGAFMFFRTSVLKEMLGFDERFFMYGEDIDLCYRVMKAGYRVDYVADTSIIHYKGESTKKGNIDYVIIFYKAMFQFYDKHFNKGYSVLFNILVNTGIIIRAVLSYLKSIVSKLKDPIFDLLLLNGITFILFLIRYKIPLDFINDFYHSAYLIINLLLTLFYLLTAFYNDQYGRNKKSISALIKTIGFTYGSVTLITFFFRQFAFSRWILLVGFLSFSSLMVLFRIYLIHFSKKRQLTSGRLRPIRMFLVSTSKNAPNVIRLIKSKIEWNYEIKGLIILDSEEWINQVEDIPVIGQIKHLPELARLHQVEHIIFYGDAVPNSTILNIITQVSDKTIQFKIIPETEEYIIGKSNVEYFDTLPFVEMSLPYFKPWNRFFKRIFDFSLSSLILLIGFPITATASIIRWFNRHRLVLQKYYLDSKNAYSIWFLIKDVKGQQFVNFYIKLWLIWRGKLSFVGAELSGKPRLNLVYKPGLTGLRQLNPNKITDVNDMIKYEQFYLQNHSIWLDLEILIQKVLRFFK